MEQHEVICLGLDPSLDLTRHPPLLYSDLSVLSLYRMISQVLVFLLTLLKVFSCTYKLYSVRATSVLLLLYAFRDLLKERCDSNFQIFSKNYQFHHRRQKSLEHFNVLFIYNSEHYDLIFGPYGCHIIFTMPPFFMYTLRVCYVLTSFDGLL